MARDESFEGGRSEAVYLEDTESSQLSEDDSREEGTDEGDTCKHEFEHETEHEELDGRLSRGESSKDKTFRFDGSERWKEGRMLSNRGTGLREHGTEQMFPFGGLNQDVEYVFDLGNKPDSNGRVSGLPWSAAMDGRDGGGVEREIDYVTLDLLLKARLMAEGDGATLMNGVEGRLGPSCVMVDIKGSSGEFMWDEGRLKIESLSNFSSARANACVYKGKWMYEVTLGTCGIQQIGWATLDCPFTYEEGVGDAPDSYAYDGKRVRKWNVSCHSYGQSWVTGDVIGCCIDLGAGEISFFRNGESLGVAFSEVRRYSEGLAYFPAFSLSQGERAELNFGSKPFVYPVPGFCPLQSPAAVEAAQAKYLLSCLKRLLQLSSSGQVHDTIWPNDMAVRHFDSADIVLSSATIVKHLFPLLQSDFIMLSVFVPFILDLFLPSERVFDGHDLVRLLFPVLEPFECTELMEKLFGAMANLYKPMLLTQSDGSPPPGYRYLKLALELMRNGEVLSAWRRSPSFYAQFELFLSQKQPNINDLSVMLPEVWWPGADCKFSSEDAMKSHCRNIKRILGMVEGTQFEMCLLLLSCSVDEDSTEWDGFVTWLLRKNKGANRNVPPPNLSDPTILNSAFFVILRLIHYHLQSQREAETPLQRFPASIFVSDLAREMDLPRLGGTLAHVEREHPLKGIEDMVALIAQAKAADGDMNPSTSNKRHPLDLKVKALDQMASLSDKQVTRLFDASLLLYHLSVADAFKSANTQNQAKLHFLSQLDDTERRLQRFDMKSGEMLAHLKEAKKRFKKEVIENTRSCCWSKMYLFRQQKQCAMYCASNYACRLLLSLSGGYCSGSEEDTRDVFLYVPEFYVDSAVDMFHALRRAEPSFASATLLARHGLEDTITFLVKHFADKRIINPDVRDGLLQSISVLLQYKDYHKAFEDNAGAREHMIPSLLTAFQERFWIPISNILVHLCRGQGFATKSSKGRDFQSPVFQQILHDTCKGDKELFSSFLNRLFNTLNWTITEFGVSLKEIREGARRRQLAEYHQQQRKCTIMFELSINLLRILEFFSQVLPEDFMQGSALNLTRMCELIRFVLIHTAAGPEGRNFEERVSHISNFYSQEKLSRSMILAPVAGILINLYRAELEANENNSEHHSMLSYLSASEPIVESMDVLESMQWSKSLSADPHSLINLRYLSELAKVLRQERQKEQSAQATSQEDSMEVDEETCTICYSSMADTNFRPCGHRSCHQCISRHLLNNKRCFFCNKEVESLDVK